MKRYALFIFDTYYPGGGWNDFVEAYDGVEDALIRCTHETNCDNFHIVDLHIGKIVEENV